MTWWWRSSILLSRALCGPAGKPLCARVHEARPAAWRTAFLISADIVFAEADHCARIHARWRLLRVID